MSAMGQKRTARLGFPAATADTEAGHQVSCREVFWHRRGLMHRGRWSRVRGYLKSSLWIVPLIAIPLGMITTRILHWLDGHLEWVHSVFAVTGARAILDAVVTSTLSFVVFTFGSLLVAI